jgi:hypothetical protein
MTALAAVLYIPFETKTFHHGYLMFRELSIL